jgi:hypothetical protein
LQGSNRFVEHLAAARPFVHVSIWVAHYLGINGNCDARGDLGGPSHDPLNLDNALLDLADSALGQHGVMYRAAQRDPGFGQADPREL